MSLWEIWISPNGTGTKDGSSPANTHPFLVGSDYSWWLGSRTAMRTALVADANQRGLNIPRVHNSVVPGIDPDYNVSSYITSPVQTVVAGRCYFASDLGEYPVSPFDSSGLISIEATSGGVGGAGTLADPHRVIQMTGWRSSDNALPGAVSGGTTIRRYPDDVPETIKPSALKKLPTADKFAASNYSGDGSAVSPHMWTGPTTAGQWTYTVQNPSPVRAVFRGNRTVDPRTSKTRQLWMVQPSATRTCIPGDPDKFLSAEPKLVGVDGVTPVVMKQGDTYHLDTHVQTSITTGTFSHSGYVFNDAGSYISWIGFEFHQVMAPFGGYHSAVFQSYCDIRTDNTKYGLWRGSGSSGITVCDLECARWQITGNAEKAFVPGHDAQRWNMSDISFDGQFVIGDQIQTLMSVASTYNAGPFIWTNIIVERCWGQYMQNSTGTGFGVYMQGDGIDAEVYGLAVKNIWCYLTGDGGIDTKTAPYWLGWPAVVVLNGHFGRNKRTLRSWAPSFPGSLSRPGPWTIRNVTLWGARQYHVYLIGASPFHKLLDWANPDGRPHVVTAEGMAAMSNDNNIGGDMDVIFRRPFIIAPSLAIGALWPNQNGVLVLGGPGTPFRCRAWTPLADPPVLTATVNGVTASEGTLMQVLDGTVENIQIVGEPAGSIITWAISGPATINSTTADTINITLRQQ